MFIGIGTPIPEIANLPGTSRPGSGGGGGIAIDLIDNNYSLKCDSAANSSINTNIGEIEGFQDTTMSFSCWFNIPVSPGGNIYSYFPVWYSLKSPDLYGGPTLLMRVYGASPGDFRITLWSYAAATGGSKVYLYSAPLYFNTWYHAVTVFTGMNVLGGSRNKIEVYLDGDTTPAIVSYNNFAPDGYGSSLTNPVIGGKYSSFLNAGAYIDEWAYWANTGLSPAIIETIYNCTNDNPGKTADLSTMSTPPTAWYRMGD